MIEIVVIVCGDNFMSVFMMYHNFCISAAYPKFYHCLLLKLILELCNFVVGLTQR